MTYTCWLSSTMKTTRVYYAEVRSGEANGGRDRISQSQNVTQPDEQKMQHKMTKLCSIRKHTTQRMRILERDKRRSRAGFRFCNYHVGLSQDPVYLLCTVVGWLNITNILR